MHELAELAAWCGPSGDELAAMLRARGPGRWHHGPLATGRPLAEAVVPLAAM